MANVLVTSSAAGETFDPWKHSTEFLLKHSAELDAFGQHKLTDDPEAADIIVFGEMGTCGKFAERVRAHAYYKRFPDKCFLFDSSDMIWPVVPGIYASLKKEHYQADQTVGGFYLYVIENAFITHRPLTGTEKYLASFVGSKNTAAVREKLFELNREDVLVRDTSSYSWLTNYHGQPPDRARVWSDYADCIADARFSLCPRGKGAASIRLFESMKMGRACVILADEWQRNEDVDWDSFSITVREEDALKIPEILEKYVDRAREMGESARAEWEKWFSEKVRFHRVAEWCLSLQERRRRQGRMRRYSSIRHMINPSNFRRYLSSKRDLYRQTGKIYW